MCLLACFMTFGVVDALRSQQTITLTFTGKNMGTGMAQKLDSIQVKDLTRIFDTTLIGVQQLVLHSTTDVDNPDMRGPNRIVLSNNFGNPFSDKTSFYVTSSEAANVTLEVFNVLGKTIIAGSTRVEQGVHRFRFEGNVLEPGLYFLTARVGSSQSTMKMLKVDRGGNANPQLVYEGRVSGEAGASTGLRKANDIGDDYRFIGFANSFHSDTILAKPQRDTTYEFRLQPGNTAPTIMSFVADAYGKLTSDTVRYTLSVKDAEGNLSKAWIDFNGDGVFDDSTSISGGDAYLFYKTVFKTQGSYLAKIRAMDAKGLMDEKSLTGPVVVTTTNTAPSITSFIADSYGVSIGDTVHYTISMKDSEGNLSKIRVDFNGDGIFDDSTLVSGGSADRRFKTAFTTPGSYLSKARVLDGQGLMAEKSLPGPVVVVAQDMPAITRIDPDTILTVSEIKISGKHFGATQGSNNVFFKGGAGASYYLLQVANYTSWSDAEINLHVPAGILADGVVYATVDGHTSNEYPFTLRTAFSVSGAISGGGVDVSGVTVSDGTRSAVTNAGGAYTILDVPNGSQTITPTKSGLLFTPATRQALVNNTNVLNVNFSAVKVYTISGVITCTGVDVSGITVSDGTRSTLTDNNGQYVISDVPNGTYSITPAKSGFIFTPISKAAVVNNADVMNVDFSANKLSSISGIISGSVDVSGITVSDGTRSALTDAGGAYSILDVPNGSYTITPSKSGLIFYPTSLAVLVNNADVVNQDFTASKPSSISGTISRSGTCVDLSGIIVSDGVRSAMTDNNGAYSIANVPNGTYTITPVKSGLTFNPVTKSVTVFNADVTNVKFTASKTLADGMVLDIDCNEYHTVTIGTQVWMVENLKTTKYNNGTPIPLVTDNTAWGALTTPGYCWYNNDSAANKDPYGALYNWHAANSGKLAPKGWHVPTCADWLTLTNNLCGVNVAGGKMKEAGTTHWASPNTGADNSSGFTALPGGYRDNYGISRNLGSSGFFWTTTENSATNALYCFLYSSGADARPSCLFPKNIGMSIRCVKDVPTVTDIDGNVYHTDTIGTQVWMVENLKTTKYNDGTPIPLVTDATAWGSLISNSARIFT